MSPASVLRSEESSRRPAKRSAGAPARSLNRLLISPRYRHPVRAAALTLTLVLACLVGVASATAGPGRREGADPGDLRRRLGLRVDQLRDHRAGAAQAGPLRQARPQGLPPARAAELSLPGQRRRRPRCRRCSRYGRSLGRVLIVKVGYNESVAGVRQGDRPGHARRARGTASTASSGSRSARRATSTAARTSRSRRRRSAGRSSSSPTGTRTAPASPGSAPTGSTSAPRARPELAHFLRPYVFRAAAGRA